MINRFIKYVTNCHGFLEYGSPCSCLPSHPFDRCRWRGTYMVFLAQNIREWTMMELLPDASWGRTQRTPGKWVQAVPESNRVGLLTQETERHRMQCTWAHSPLLICFMVNWSPSISLESKEMARRLCYLPSGAARNHDIPSIESWLRSGFLFANKKPLSNCCFRMKTDASVAVIRESSPLVAVVLMCLTVMPLATSQRVEEDTWLLKSSPLIRKLHQSIGLYAAKNQIIWDKWLIVRTDSLLQTKLD